MARPRAPLQQAGEAAAIQQRQADAQTFHRLAETAVRAAAGPPGAELRGAEQIGDLPPFGCARARRCRCGGERVDDRFERVDHLVLRAADFLLQAKAVLLVVHAGELQSFCGYLRGLMVRSARHARVSNIASRVYPTCAH